MGEVDIYRMHEDSMDLAIKINEVIYHHSHLKLEIEWIDLGYMGQPWTIGEPETITILNKELHKWKIIDPTIIRTKSGRP